MTSHKTKKVTVLRKDLPPVNKDNKYFIRYRIVSDDKNRSSHWSPIYVLGAVPKQPVNLNLSITGQSAAMVWEDEVIRTAYDVFTKANFEIQQKELTSNVATITTKFETNISVGDTIVVEGVNATLDGEHIVTAVDVINKTISYSVIGDDQLYTGTSGTVSLGFIFHGTTPIHTYSFLTKTNSYSLEVAVQIESYENVRSDVLTIYQSPSPVIL